MTGLKQGTIRHLARDEITIKKAFNSETGILLPMYEYFDKKEMERKWVKKNDRSEKQVTYHTRSQASYDPEELELCNELNRATDIR